MTSFLNFHAFAAARGDGLRPEIQRLLDRVAIDPRFATTVQEDGMLQSGPDPKSKPVHVRSGELPRQEKPRPSNAAHPQADSVVQFIRKQVP